jgi:hypothetical protein
VKYIQTWDGIEHQEEIFKLLSFLRPESFERRLSSNSNNIIKKFFNLHIFRLWFPYLELSKKFFIPLQNLHEKLSPSWKVFHHIFCI